MMQGKQSTLIRKANDLVNARYSFSIWETRVFLKLLTLIQPWDDDFQKYRFKVSDFIREFKIFNKDVYTELEKVTEGLLKKVIRLPWKKNGKETIFKTTLVSSFEYFVDGSGYIAATFHPDLKPHLLQLKSQYLSYDIRNVMLLSSAHSLRMYEVLKQYETIWTRTVALDELKELLGVADKYDDRYFNFKTRVLLQAQKDLEKYTDISFVFSELKQGRTVEKIRFEVRKNAANAPETSQILTKETVELLAKYGIQPNAELTQMIVNQPFEVVKDICVKAEKIFAQKRRTGNPIANESGYLLKLLHNPASFQAAKAKKSTQKSVYEIEKEKRETLRKRFDEELKNKTERLRETYLTEAFEKSFLESQNNNLFFDKMRKMGKENMFFKAQIDRHLQKMYLQPDEYDFETWLTKQANW